MKIRKLHRITAITFAPFFVLLAASGCALLFRHAEVYPKATKKFLVSLHTWEIVAPYIGIIAGLGLLIVTITGIIIFFKRTA
ncbi:MAG: PepSY domain-containing protein [Candidatus Electrothrix sp. AW2]|nr:PepSY domain-containing protein [Candidatus Electrothrix sp. AX1]MCI5116828.1 PepSY domain-containing protein [Candidatus Electrothrix gigas]MCI5135417.1 PepSY domain-containing protein [Candidatus Electrothrix gigas]MCI5178329.1 PepSY domain-containing protein [Candidatus Electrothrix gigas]MCI5180957.1 PepSY domain-containing protein [Candidatus Electrothrix gigas]